MRVRAVVASICLLSMLPACGSDEDPADDDGASATGCSEDPGSAGCTFSPCGGDLVGTWSLITFCAPSCVSSVYDQVSFAEDGSYNGGQGTWESTGSDSFTITVGNATASYSYCVSGGLMWTQHGTNCGTESGPVTIVRQRGDCAGGDAGGGRR